MVKTIKVSERAHRHLSIVRAKENNSKTYGKIIDDLLFSRKIKEAVK